MTGEGDEFNENKFDQEYQQLSTLNHHRYRNNINLSSENLPPISDQRSNILPRYTDDTKSRIS